MQALAALLRGRDSDIAAISPEQAQTQRKVGLGMLAGGQRPFNAATDDPTNPNDVLKQLKPVGVYSGWQGLASIGEGLHNRAVWGMARQAKDEQRASTQAAGEAVKGWMAGGGMAQGPEALAPMMAHPALRQTGTQFLADFMRRNDPLHLEQIERTRLGNDQLRQQIEDERGAADAWSKYAGSLAPSQAPQAAPAAPAAPLGMLRPQQPAQPEPSAQAEQAAPRVPMGMLAGGNLNQSRMPQPGPPMSRIPVGGPAQADAVPMPPAAQPSAPHPLSTAGPSRAQAEYQQQVDALGPLLRNPRTREYALKEIQRLQGENSPGEQLKRRLTELQIASQERDLNAPKDTVKTLKDGETIWSVDPRTGAAVKIAGDDEKTGKVTPGYKANGDGTWTAIPGGPADVKMSEKRQQDYASMQAMFQSLDNLARDANEVSTHPGLSGNFGLQGKIPNIPGGASADAAAKIMSLKAKSAFTTLQDMRNSSKSGGALGAVSDKEMVLLQSAIAALDASQSVEQARKEYDKIIHYTQAAKSRIAAAYNDHWNNDRAGARSVADPLASSARGQTPTSPQGPVRVTSPEDVSKLPSGTIFLTPDGRAKVAP